MALPHHIRTLALKQPFKRTAQSAATISSEEEKLPNPPAAIATTGFLYPDEPVEMIMRKNDPIGFRFRRRGCGFTIAMDDSYETHCFTSHQFTAEGGFFQVNMTPQDYKYALKVAGFELSADDLHTLATKLDEIDQIRIKDMYEAKPLSIKPLGPQATCFEFSDNGRQYTITAYSSSANRAASFIMSFYCDKGHETPRTLNLHEQERAINRLSVLMTLNQSIQYADTIQSLREHIATAKAKTTRPETKKFTINPLRSDGICFELSDGNISYTLTAFHSSVGRKPSFVMSCVDGTGNLLPIPLSTDEKKAAIDKIVYAMTSDQCIQYAVALDALRQAVYMASDPPPAQDAGRFAPARSINFFG